MRGPQGGLSELMSLHAVVVRPLTSHSYKSGTKHAGSSPEARLAINHQARRAGICWVSRMKGELHHTEMVRLEAY